MYRGLTKQQWAALQHQKATKSPRKALSFQYPQGRGSSNLVPSKLSHLPYANIYCDIQLVPEGRTLLLQDYNNGLLCKCLDAAVAIVKTTENARSRAAS